MFVVYIDPGSGSLILQMLLAGVAGVYVFIKYQGKRIAGFLGRMRRHGDDGT